MTVAVDDGDGLKAGEPEAYMSNPFAETAPKFSPDGHWLAYESNETGPDRNLRSCLPSGGPGWQVANFQRRRLAPGLVAEWPRASVPIG
jgi:hypothetical protein